MAEVNPNSRLEAFCDGVFAIAMTLLVIDIKIPATREIKDTVDFWLALREIAPSVFAFLLSFTIILITWVNHHASLKLVNKSSPSFNYANGFLLLTVVVIPFPTALIGEYFLSDHPTPAVFLYNAVLAIQGIAWILMSVSANRNNLGASPHAVNQLKTNGRNGYYAFAFYSLLAILALWFPLPVVIITTLSWVFWLIYGINVKHE